MNKLDLKTVGKLKPDPIFKGLSKALKDPANFEKIEKRLQEILKTEHEHKTVTAYVKCAECQTKREGRQKAMKDEGFKSIQQYMQWKKIMTIIKNKSNFQVK